MDDMKLLEDDDLDALVAAADASSAAPWPSTTSVDASADFAASEEPLVGDLWWFFDEEMENDSGILAVSDVSPATATTTTTNAKESQEDIVPTPYSRVVASRKRSKAEREHLKQRVSELEAQLATLKEPASSSPEGQHTEPLSAPSVVASVEQFWQRLAQSEQHARQQAVAENLRLREQVEGQLRTARSLMKLLRKRPADQAAQEQLQMPRHVRACIRDDDDAVFQALELNIQSRYGQIDDIFKASGLAGNIKTYQDARMCFAQNQVETSASVKAPAWFLEFVNSNIVPFDWKMTRDVAWRAMLCPTIPLTNGEYKVVAADGDSVRALFTVTMKVRGTDVVSRARFVSRRFLEADRFVVVWALNSIVQGGLLKSQRVVLQEDGWSAISPLEERGEELCLTQACGRMQPTMAIRPGSKLEEHVGVLTDVVLDCYHETQRGMYDFTGRLLLDEAACRRRETNDMEAGG